MSHARVTIGNAGGKNLVSFSAPGDSGALLYYVSPPNIAQHNYSEVIGCKEFTFGLTGTGTGLEITLYFTNDVNTAAGLPGFNNWYLVPSPSSEPGTQWANPLVNVDSQDTCYFQGNAIAFRAVAALDPNGVPLVGTIGLQLLGAF